MKTTLAIALYRPKNGKAKELKELVKKHLPTLREYELVTGKPAYLAQAKDGTIMEIFEWVSDAAKDAAHQHPAIAKIWEEMMPIADFPTLSELTEATTRFPNFEVIDPGQ